MDIRASTPEQYAEWLLSLGVKPKDIRERMAHDMLRALSKQLNAPGAATGFEELKASVEEMLAADALERAIHQ